jgi:hypothetical protein
MRVYDWVFVGLLGLRKSLVLIAVRIREQEARCLRRTTLKCEPIRGKGSSLNYELSRYIGINLILGPLSFRLVLIFA